MGQPAGVQELLGVVGKKHPNYNTYVFNSQYGSEIQNELDTVWIKH